MEDIMTLPGI